MTRFTDIVDEDIADILRADLPWDRLSGARILVSGAGGFLPAYMVETLLALNTERLKSPLTVLALVRNAKRAQERFARHMSSENLEFIEQDVCAPLTVDGPITHIIHAASQASPKYYGSDPVGTARPNVIGTDSLLQLAVEKKSKGFLYFSSSEVYGTPASIPTGEEDFGPSDPSQLRACYAESKRAGETLCVSYAHQHQVPAVIVRPFHTYGPGMRLDDGRVFADFVAAILAGRNITLNSDGLATRSFCYLADATEAFFRALLNDAPGMAYNVGNPDGEISIRDLAQLIATLDPLGKCQVDHKVKVEDGYIPSSISRSQPAIEKIKALGWQPKTGLEEGFRRTIESFR